MADEVSPAPLPLSLQCAAAVRALASQHGLAPPKGERAGTQDEKAAAPAGEAHAPPAAESAGLALTLWTDGRLRARCVPCEGGRALRLTRRRGAAATEAGAEAPAAPVGCDAQCTRDHGGGTCLVCGRGWGGRDANYREGIGEMHTASAHRVPCE